MNVEAQSDGTEPATVCVYAKSSTYNNLTEDSGYTSFITGSEECSELSNPILDPKLTQLNSTLPKNQSDSFQLSSSPSTSKTTSDKCTAYSQYDDKQTTSTRRGIKRHFKEDDTDGTFNSKLTSDNYKAGDIQSLYVNETSDVATIPRSCNDSLQSQTADTTLALQCDKSQLKQFQPKTERSMFRLGQKVDIIKYLYPNWILAMNKIFSYLDGKDIYNFSLVSSLWLRACKGVDKANCKRKEYMVFMNTTKENYKNRDKKEVKDASGIANETNSLRTIDNVMSSWQDQATPTISPPGTPRTIKFKKFVKSALLDSRMQISCVKCQGPAKVTEESTGEMWAECSSISCGFQYCRFCHCPRHPGKICLLYDFDQPSPSKRKKPSSIVNSKKSRKNLKRLL